MSAAILDLGTNTFNLVIGELSPDNSLKILCSKLIPVKLGEGGINHGEISEPAYKRGIDAIVSHFNTIQQFGAGKIRAFGTSALRTAMNGKSFTDEIKSRTGIEIEVITGDQEAEYIYYGVRQTIPNQTSKYLILDIGGGSNEFILADNSKIYWKKSYPLGIARLLARFKPSDPLSSSELFVINKYIEEELADLFEIISKNNIDTLIGASGAFETFVAMINEKEDFESQIGMFPESDAISDTDFKSLYYKLISSTSMERRQMKGLEAMRIEMIVLAIHFVKFVTDRLNIKNIIQSNFSLKEGAILELLKN